MDSARLLALAVRLIENTKLKDALAEIDARPLPRLVRAFHIQQLMEVAFPVLWDGLALHEDLGEQGAAAIQQELFEALCLVARARGEVQRPELAWTRVGEPADPSSPATSSHRAVGYALVYDERRQAAVFISGSSPKLFGQTWEWRGEAWHKRPTIEHAVPESHQQGFTGLIDAAHDGIACWTLVAQQPGDFEKYQPFGLLVHDERVEVVETSEPPVVPSQMLFAFGAIFGLDPASGDTIMLARDGLYALREGRWRSLCTLEPSATSKEWRPGTRAAFVHHEQLYFTWTDTDNLSRRCRLLRFTGHGVQEVMATSPPSGGWDAVLTDSTGACFLTSGTLWRLDGAGDALAWQQVASAPTLPKIRSCGGAVLPGGAVLVGPGELEDGAGEGRYHRCFFHVRGVETTQLGEVLKGVGVVPPDRTLLGHDDRVLAVYASGQVDRVGRGEVESLAEARPELQLTLSGVCLDGGGNVHAVAADATMWLLEPTGWRQVGEADAHIASWTIVCCAWDPPRDRMVIWGYHGDPESRLAERTAAWSGGRWARLEAGSTLPPGDRYLRAQMDCQLLFDTHLAELLFVGANSICVLSGDRWHPSKPNANIYRGASTGSALLVHDQASATTLFIDTKDRWCGRLSGAELELAANLRSAPDQLATYAGSGQARRAAMVYVPASRSVLVFSSGKSYGERWELPLADVFLASTQTGERKDFAKSAPSERRFTGPALRRLSDAPGKPPSGSVNGFRRFGEEPPTDWPLPTQTSDELMLAFDSLRQRLVLLRSDTDVIECWVRTDARWQLLHRSENRVPWSAAVRLSSDPTRGAVLWCVSEEHGASGYSITDDGLEPLGTSGDGPVRDDKYDHRDKVVFAWDRRDHRLLGFSTEGLWALSDDNRWSRLASWDGATALHAVGSFGKTDGGAWDVVAQRLVLWKLDYSEGLRCWAVTPDGIALVEEASVAEVRGGVLAASDSGLMLYEGSARTLRRLEPSGWVAVEPGRDAPALDGFGDPVMVCYRESVELATRRPFRFHSFERGRWETRGQPVAVTRPSEVVQLVRHYGQVFAANRFDAWLFDGARWQPAPSFAESLLSTPWQSEVRMGSTIAGLVGGKGPVRAVAACGAIGQLVEGRWDLQRPRGDVPMRDGHYDRVAAHCPIDDSWLIVSRGSDDAITFRGTSDGVWTQVCALAFGAGLAAYVSRQLAFDTRLGGFVLAGSDGILHLRDGAWTVAQSSDLPSFDKLVHDPQTGATLLIDVGRGKAYALDATTCTELAGVAALPPPTHQRALRSVSPTECVFDADERRLIWFDSEDVWGNYELDLATFFEQARALYDRAP